MLYVQQSLAPDEELVHVGHFHWLYDVMAIMNIFWGLFFAIGLLVACVVLQKYIPVSIMTSPLDSDDGWIGSLQKLHPGIKLASLLVFLLGVLKFAHMLVTKITTEIAVTTTRLVYKRGLVARYVGEINIDRIEGVTVLQSILGRMFNFGQLAIRGMGVGELILPVIADPVKFRRAIEKARTG
jgi:hypothetical protein